MSLPRSFGAYTLLRRLAVGGMAEIYVARTLGLGGFEKLAALKLVHPHLSADPQFVRMLIDEAKIVVLLTHANIAQVFDLGCIEGTYYIAMEYVDGIDVQGLSRAAERLGRKLDIPVCCFVVAELLNGLDYAHRKRDASGRPLGIVHRDISPQNVVVSRGGEVKLVDFGIAKTNMRSDRTDVGVIKGKYGYMSPEQAWADPTDRRSDVFSAGVMLYELLTGSVLYTASSVAELIAKVRRAEIPSPSSVRKEIPEELSTIVMRALALEPSDRYQTAIEMGDALREYLYRHAQSISGARLGRYVAELLEADARLAEENKLRADDTGGLRALRREEFLRTDNSVIFSLPELSGATRSEAVGKPRPARAPELPKVTRGDNETMKPPRRNAGTPPQATRPVASSEPPTQVAGARVMPSEAPTSPGGGRVNMPSEPPTIVGSLRQPSEPPTLNHGPTLAPRKNKVFSSAAELAAQVARKDETPRKPVPPPTPASGVGDVAARRAREDSVPPEPNTEDLTELWTARYFAQQGNALGFVTEIRVQPESSNDNTHIEPPTFPGGPFAPATTLAPEQTNSMAPPSLSWPPRAPSLWPRTKFPSPPAVRPPRGEDPSLPPLPKLGDVPNFRRASGKPGFGLKHAFALIICALLGAIAALVAWDSVPTCTLELLSLPANANVRINGVLQHDRTPLRITGLRRHASYRVRLELESHKPVEFLYEANLDVRRKSISLPPK